MAETEVSKMVAIEEKCGLDMSSYQDLPKPDCYGINHHAQTNDLDNSYVFVNGVDGAVGDKDVILGGSSVLPEPEDSQIGKNGAVGEEGPLNEGVNGNIELSNGDFNQANYNTSKQEGLHEDRDGVQVSLTDYPVPQTSKVESSPESEQVPFADSQVVYTETTKSVAEADFKQVKDSDGEIISMPETDTEKIVDQNEELEGLEGQQEDVDGVTIVEPPPHAENHEFEVRVSELEEEIEENRGSNNMFLNGNSSNSPNNGEEQCSTSVIEALEAPQRVENLVVDVDEHELQSVGVDAADEAKSTKELAEVSEHEVSTSTSLDSELFLINNMGKKLEEEVKTDLSLCTLENQNSDMGVNGVVHKRVGETEESKPVGSSSDSDVQSTGGLILEDKNEDSSVSEVENGAQYLEESQEQHAGNSSDCDLVLEEKTEDSSVSDVDTGAQYHEESEEQPVQNNSDSHVQTTCDLVLEEKNENLLVSGVENGAQYHEESQAQPVVSSTDSQLGTTRDLASEGNNEVSSVSEVENGAQYHEESQEQPLLSSSCDLVSEKGEAPSVSEVENGSIYPEDSLKQSDGCEASHDPTPSETMSDTSKYPETEVVNGSKYPEDSQEQSDGWGASHDTAPSETMANTSVQIQSNPASKAWSPQSGNEVSDVDEIGRVSSPQESVIIKEVVHVHDSEIRCTLDEASSGFECALGNVLKEKEIAFEGVDEAHSKTEASSVKSKVGDSAPGTLDVKLEPDSHVHDLSVRINGEKSDDLAVSCTTDVSDSLDHNSDAAANFELEVDGVGNIIDKLDDTAGNTKENMFVQENENTRNSQNEETSVALAEVSPINETDGEDKSIKIKTKPFNFLIRTPRFDDEDLREQIRLAKLQVDEKTKLRDAIQLQIQEKRQANSQINGIDYEFSKGEGRNARKLVRTKRMEIDSLQSVINKAKNALSIEDIDSQIHNMEHMIQHETLPLKEEKQLIREIKQLKQLREQLSSNMGSQDEIKQALEQREETEERLKILRKELDILKNRALKAEATATEAEKKYDDENQKVKELQSQFRAADEVRQAAYAQWQNLRKEFSKKNKYFFKYKDDAAVASNCAFSRDSEALYRLCTNHVGSFMELWNTNPEFREDYVKFNARSNIRRFGTLDCRSLGPDEEPPAKPSYADERGNRMASTPAKVDHAPQIPSVDLKQKTPSENVTVNSKSIKKVTEPKSQKVQKGPDISVQVNGFGVHASNDLTDELHEEPVKSREEIESMRKAEELRKEKVEAMLKEQRRLEALEKANEARERKKRQAEKLQQRAELKTQKEAEQREKEREKRQRKKERKKAGLTDANDTNNNCETAPSSESAAENSKEIDVKVKDVPPAAAKKSQKPWLATKQSKSKSVPPSIRNRNKKKLQQWMWVGITSLLILVLFWLGNIGVFPNVALKRRAPAY